MVRRTYDIIPRSHDNSLGDPHKVRCTDIPRFRRRVRRTALRKTDLPKKKKKGGDPCFLTILGL